LSATFPAAANINDVAFPVSLVCFGTRAADGAGDNFIWKGANFRALYDNSAGTANLMQGHHVTSATEPDAVSTNTFKVADGSTHIAMTISAGMVVKLYKNGTEVSYTSQATGTGTPSSDAASDLIFALNSVTHAAYYNVELSAANITSLYNGGAGVNCYTVQPSAILVSTDAAGPTITAQPTNQTVFYGATATFNITATGTGTLHYQWKFNGSNVGSDSSSYARTNCVFTDDDAAITCDVTDDNGTTTSSTAYLFVPVSANAFLFKG